MLTKIEISKVLIPSDRLRLRGLEATDLIEELSYLDPNEVCHSAKERKVSSAEAKESLQGIGPAEDRKESDWLQFAIELKDRRETVGHCALRRDNEALDTGEIRHAIMPQHRGQGYGTEAVRALLDYAFNQLELKRIVAITDVDNLPAERLAARVGMTREPPKKGGETIGAWGDDYLYAIAQREWEQSASE